MRRIPVRRDNRRFQVEMTRSGEGKVQPLLGKALQAVPAVAEILIGDRTPAYGGGLASIGYVMVGGRAIGSASVDKADVERGWLEI